MSIHLLGFPTTLGLPREAYRHAPEALRKAGLLSSLEGLGAEIRDAGNIPIGQGNPADPVEVRLDKVVEAARLQADFWQKICRPGDLMLTLGGDHSTSLGTLWALTELGRPFDVVWIDAHGDFNVVKTSPSGNPHGMVLALACGLMEPWMPKLIEPQILHLWGIRELDAGEQALVNQFQVEVISPEEARKGSHGLIDQLQPDVFLSFDVDSVDPAEAPGTMTPVPGGFTSQEALALVQRIAETRNLLAVDIVEFHPDQDQQDRTLNLAQKVAAAVVLGQLQRNPGLRRQRV
jgi:arginase